MPIYLDRHQNLGVSPDELAAAHLKDLEAQEQFGVSYLSYWFDFNAKAAYCLVDAPTSKAAQAVHEVAHGVMPDKLIEVKPEEVYKYLGAGPLGAPASFDPMGSLETTLRTIVFTDIVGSSEAANLHGDEVAMEMVRAHNRIVREQLEAHNGREVKHTGDGIMACFTSVAGAVECSLAVQDDLRAREDLPQVQVRIGLAAGEPVAEGDDLFGTAVNLAARVCSVAEAGAVYVTNTVRELALGKKFKFEPLQPVVLKGFPDPVALARVVA